MGKPSKEATATSAKGKKPILPGKNSYRNMPKAFRCHSSWVRKVGF